MSLEELIKDKTIKPKEQTEMISSQLLDGTLSTESLIAFAAKAKDPIKATCIEAMEFATQQQPQISDENVLKFVTHTLTEKAPRVKWESAKVIGNIANLYPTKLHEAIANLITNTDHTGTVVRWSAAFALGQIAKLKTSNNLELVPAIEAISAREEKNSIKKIYTAALKVAKG